MMKRGTIAALAILAILIGVTFFLFRGPGATEEVSGTPTATPYMLASIPEADVMKVGISASTGKVSIERDSSGLWKLVEPVNPAIDLGTMEMHITDLLNLRVRQQIETQLTDEAVGLDKPTAVFEITARDNTIHKYEIGSLNPLGDGYYARADGGPIVLLNQASVENVLQLITSSYATATPSPEPIGTAPAGPSADSISQPAPGSPQ
jgi:hypothetical protein